MIRAARGTRKDRSRLAIVPALPKWVSETATQTALFEQLAPGTQYPYPGSRAIHIVEIQFRTGHAQDALDIVQMPGRVALLIGQQLGENNGLGMPKSHEIANRRQAKRCYNRIPSFFPF
jgi:hypothetical protein